MAPADSLPPDIDVDNPVGGLNDAELALRDERIWQLRLQHLSQRTIAARVGVSPVVVWQVIRKRISEVLAPLVCEVVAEEDARLEFLFEHLLPGIEGSEVPAIEAGRKLSESRRRLFGADGAVTVNVNHGDLSAIDAAYQDLVAEMNAANAVREAKLRDSRGV